MRRVRGFHYKDGHSHRKKAKDKSDLGRSVGVVHASEINDKTRHALDFRCKNGGCNCSMHFRDAYETERRPSEKSFPTLNDIPGLRENDRGGISFPKTFAKDPSSSHIDGCPFDYTAVAKTSPNLAVVNDHLLVLVNFQLGTDKDLDPAIRPGQLKNKLAQAARHRGTKGFESLQEVTSFLESHFGDLSAEALEDVMLITPKNEVLPLNQYIVQEDNARTYLEKAGQWPSHGLLKLKPAIIHEDALSGDVRIECEPIPNNTGMGAAYIKPQIVLGTANEMDIAQLQQMIEWDNPVMVSGWFNTFPHSNNDTATMSVRVRGMNQLAMIDDSHYNPPIEPGRDMLGAPPGHTL